jgi:hypothetical protein
MNRIIFTTLVLVCATANAQVYKCPAKDAGSALTNAEIRIGPRNGAHALHGDVDQVNGGANIHFGLPDEVPGWLVCQYGGRRPEAWIQLAPMTTACDLVIRGMGRQDTDQQALLAVATCKKKEPPPPDLV